MAWGDSSSPARFGGGQVGSTNQELFLKMFAGEVLNAYTENTMMRGKCVEKVITAGKSYQFPKTYKATAEYHTAGQEMLGNDIDTDEVLVTIDGLLVSHVGIYDLDEKISHFDVRGEYAAELGRSLARKFDADLLRQLVLSARGSGTSGWDDGGHTITDANLAVDGGTDVGKEWIDAIRAACVEMESKDVPMGDQKWLVTTPGVFDALKYAADTNGHYLVINRDFSSQATVAGANQVLRIEDVNVIKSNLVPTADDRATSGVNSKYQAAYDTTLGVMFTREAAATLIIQDIAMETERDVRRQEDFLAAKMAVGHGALRNAAAVEFRTGAPTTT